MQILEWIQQNPELATVLVSAVLAIVSLFAPGVSGIVARLIALFLQYNSQFRKILQELPRTPDTPERIIQDKAGALVRNLAKTPAGKKAIKRVAKSMDIDVTF